MLKFFRLLIPSTETRELFLAVRGDGAIEREEITTVQGVVVDPVEEASDAWHHFFSKDHNQTVGGNKWEARYRRKTEPLKDNGREFNPATVEWDYTVKASRIENPCDMTATMKSLFPTGAEQYDCD